MAQGDNIINPFIPKNMKLDLKDNTTDVLVTYNITDYTRQGNIANTRVNASSQTGGANSYVITSADEAGFSFNILLNRSDYHTTITNLQAAIGKPLTTIFYPDGEASGDPTLSFTSVITNYGDSGNMTGPVTLSLELGVQGVITPGTVT